MSSPLSRDRPLNPASAALLLVDVQNGTCGPGQLHQRQDFHRRFRQETLPALERLLAHSRACSLEVIYTVIENLTRDGRERSLDYKLSGLGFPPGSDAARVLDELRPGDDDLVLPKSSSSVFNSTNLDYLLRNLGIRDLFVAGVLTDQCIDHTVKDGADRGYYVSCIVDACQAETSERHAAALQCFRGYCRLLTVDDFIALPRVTSWEISG